MSFQAKNVILADAAIAVLGTEWENPHNRLDNTTEMRYVDDMNIEKEIRRRTRQAGLTVYALAKKSGVSLSSVQQFWHGGGLRCSSAERLAAALGCKIILQPEKGAK